MGIKVYNTLSKKKEEYIPLVEGHVNMYACGITVYDDCHIGHSRQAIVYDVIRKYFKYKGFSMTYVRNYTDVDDKIIKRAAELNQDPIEYSAKKILESEQDLKLLNVDDADVSPKVSENIPEIQDLIKGLIEKDYAYVTSEENVYFKVKNFTEYGKLSNRKVEDLYHGVRKETDDDKEDPLDFALWKSAKEGEIFWESPWGKGRPGWHIECSAMSIKYLGSTFDIHGGGKDLIFPHHENEIAQSEAYTGKLFAKYWIHNGLITINGQKMSKSLGNSITIKDALSKYQSDVVRFSMLNSHYSSNLDLSYEEFDKSEKHLYYFYNTLLALDEFLSINSTANEPETTIKAVSTADKIPSFEKIDLIEADFQNAMDDDFNTALAISNLFTLFKQLNDLIIMKKIDIETKSSYLKIARDKLKTILGVLGFLQDDPLIFVTTVKTKYLIKLKVSKESILKKIDERNIAKSNKQYEVSDAIRSELLSLGIILKDTANGCEWDIKELYAY